MDEEATQLATQEFDPVFVAEQMETQIETSLTASLDIASTPPMRHTKKGYLPGGLKGIATRSPWWFGFYSIGSVLSVINTGVLAYFTDKGSALIAGFGATVMMSALFGRIFYNLFELTRPSQNPHLTGMNKARKQLDQTAKQFDRNSAVRTALMSTATKLDKVATIRYSVGRIGENPQGHATMLRLAGRTETQVASELDAAAKTEKVIDSKMKELTALLKAIGTAPSLVVGTMNAHQMLNVADHLLEDIDTTLTLFRS